MITPAAGCKRLDGETVPSEVGPPISSGGGA